MDGFDAHSAIEITKKMGEIQDITKKVYGDVPMNNFKMTIDENEVTFSITKKGHKSAIALLPKEKWNQ